MGYPGVVFPDESPGVQPAACRSWHDHLRHARHATRLPAGVAAPRPHAPAIRQAAGTPNARPWLCIPGTVFVIWRRRS